MDLFTGIMRMQRKKRNTVHLQSGNTALHTVKTVLHTVKTVLHTVNTVLHTVKTVLHTGKTVLHTVLARPMNCHNSGP